MKDPHNSFHPVVAHYCKNANIEGYSVPIDKEKDLLATLTIQLIKAHNGKFSLDQALNEAEDFLVKNIHSFKDYDQNLLILFLVAWFTLVMDTTDIHKAQNIANHAELLASESTVPELRSDVIGMKAKLARKLGNIKLFDMLTRESLDILPSDSPHLINKILIDRIYHLALMGRMEDAKDDVLWIGKKLKKGSTMHTVFNMARFIQNVETCQMAEAEPLLSDILKVKKPEIISPCRQHICLFNLIETAVSQKEKQLPDFDQIKDIPGASACCVTHALLKKYPDLALKTARKEAKENDDFITGKSFFSYDLIRSELSSGNHAAAWRLIRRRHAINNRNYIDDFFIARVELLAGNLNNSKSHMNKVHSSCRQYKAAKRLDIEIKLSLELPPPLFNELIIQHKKEDSTSAPLSFSHKSATRKATGLDRLIGSSEPMRKVRENIERFSELDLPVLITGETGTGKDVVAHAIHETSPRKSHPFIAVNCGAITDTLLESELFGHAVGAFTGAQKEHKGFFEEAGEGIVLLDEIGDISERLQVSLLRVIETNEIWPIGSNAPRKLNFRMLASTNADLSRLAQNGAFRKDLLYRLQKLEISIPPLRERKEDIVELAFYFLNEDRLGLVPASISPALTDAFMDYSWPGNARELRNVVERMRLLHSDKLFYDVADLDDKFRRLIEKDKGQRLPQNIGKQYESEISSIPESSNRKSDPKTDKQFSEDGLAERVIQNNSTLRRLEKLRMLFRQYKKLRRIEIAEILGISYNTATSYLKKLREEGLIEKVKPNRSPRTHYFKIIDS